MIHSKKSLLFEKLADFKPDSVAVIGIPSDANSSFLPGAALAPARIREAFHSGAANLCAENGLDLAEESRFVDLGDIEFKDGTDQMSQITDTVAQLLVKKFRLISLGGDHAITYPVIKAFSNFHQPLTILHLDAHPDLYDELDGNRYSHACPFARIMEAGLAQRLIQVGIRTMNPHQRRQADKFGVEVFEMRHWQADTDFGLSGLVYLSLDLDVLDPAFAPGISHHEPGGMSVRDVLRIIQNLPVALIGADIVELNPNRDLIGMTAMTAAKCLKEIAANML